MPDKKRVAGTVDRVEGNAIVVVFRDPDSGDIREAIVNKRKLQKIEVKEGDPVTVELSMMLVEEKSKSVTLVFNGVKSGDMAKKFFSYLVDGGLEDLLIEELSGHGITLGISGCDKKRLTVSFEVAKDKPKKAVKKNAVHQAKAETLSGELVECVRLERKTGKSVELRAFAKKHNIKIKKKPSARRPKKA